MTATPWWMPPVGLSREDELAYMKGQAAFARGKVIGISHAYGMTFMGPGRRKIGRALNEAIAQRDAIEARVMALLPKAKGKL